MAKKTKAGTGHQDIDAMTKTQIKAYYKEICEFYLENGWRDTLSHYALSPKQAKEITAKVRAKKDKAEAAEKAKRKQAKAKKKAAKAAAPKKKAAPKKAAAPKKKAAAKAETRKKTARKKPGKTLSIPSNAGPDEVLDFLLNYRSSKKTNLDDFITLDEVIIDLTTQVRAA